MNKEEIEYRIKVLKMKAYKIIDHIIWRLRDNYKYNFTSACTANLEIYFKILNKIHDLEEKLI